MYKNQRGFAIVEGMLLLLLAAVIGGVGWFVWSSNKNANDSLSSAGRVNEGDAPKIAPVDSYQDCLKFKTSTLNEKTIPMTCTTKAGKKFSDPNPTAGWKSYTSKAGKYSLKHPDGWSEVICDPAETDLTLHLGPTKATSANCDTEQFAQIPVISTPAVPTESEQNFDPDYYKDQTSKNVTVDGVKGVRRTAKLKSAQNNNLPKLPADTLAVSYIFLKPGRSYIILYVQTPKGAYSVDNLAAFDYMVQHTLKFTD